MTDPKPQRQQRIRELFADAIARSAADREAFVRGAASDDPTLADEVLALVRAHDAAAGARFLERTTGAFGPPGASKFFATITEKAGTRIGHYKLLELLGEGGFGSVFVAEQERPVRRRVALKIIKLGMDTRAVVARFEQERQALALMDHPNIARVLDAGATESGRPYFVMELVKGVPITEYCDRERLSVRERLELFMQVCSAVQHAHQKGVIHRDLKPRNVLVSTLDDRPAAKVIDFGIAKATDHTLTEKTIYTEHRAFVGTPEYMSPEQAEGSLDIDTRSDVYSLGVLLYELLTGTTPFQERELHRAAYDEIQRIIREVEPVQPSTRLTQSAQTIREVANRRKSEPRSLGLLVRGELDWIAMKALEKDRVRRYESASALSQDLQRHLNGEPIVAAPPGALYRVRKFAAKHRKAVVGATAFAILLLAGVSGTTWQWWRAQSAAAELRTTADDLWKANQRLERQWQVAGDALAQIVHEGTDGTTRVRPAVGLDHFLHDDSVSMISGMALAQMRAAKEANRNLDAANRRLEEETVRAQSSAYVANIALAQSAIRAADWPKVRERLAACPESQRGWEWRFLMRQAEAIAFEIPGSAPAVDASSDGTRFAIGDAEGIVHVHASLDGREVCRVPCGRCVSSLGWSSAGDRIVTRDIQCIVHVVDGARGQSTPLVMPASGRATTVAISPRGDVVAIGFDDGQIRFWSADGGSSIGHSLVTDGSVYAGGGIGSIRFGADGGHLFVSMADQFVVWNVANGQRIGMPIDASGIVVSDSRETGVIVSDDGTLVRWRLHAGQEPDAVRRMTGELIDTARSNGALQAASLTSIGVIVWDLDQRTPLGRSRDVDHWRAPGAFVHGTADLVYSDSESLDGVGSTIGVVGHGVWPIWDVSSTEIELVKELHGVLSGSADTNGGRRIVPDGRMLRLVSTESDQQAFEIQLEEPIETARFTEDGNQILVKFVSGNGVILDARERPMALESVKEWWREHEPARTIVEGLLASTLPLDSLDGRLRGDDAIPPLRRIVAADLLAKEIAQLSARIERQWNDVKQGRLDRAELLAAIESADLPPRVREGVRAKVVDWTPRAMDFNHAAWQVIRFHSDELGARSSWDRARALIEKAIPMEPHNWVLVTTAGVALYRIGRIDDAIKALETSEVACMASGNGPWPANWAFLAMAWHKGGDPERAAEARAKFDNLRGVNEENAKEILEWKKEIERVFASPADGPSHDAPRRDESDDGSDRK